MKGYFWYMVIAVAGFLYFKNKAKPEDENKSSGGGGGGFAPQQMPVIKQVIVNGKAKVPGKARFYRPQRITAVAPTNRTR